MNLLEAVGAAFLITAAMRFICPEFVRSYRELQEIWNQGHVSTGGRDEESREEKEVK
jgi:hypothetical protein